MIHGVVINILVAVMGLVLIGGGVLLAANGVRNRENGKRFLGGVRRDVEQKKMVINPKTAIHEPGICQCNCALAYHRGGGACAVPGCPCQQFIPSTLDIADLEAVANANIVRINIDTINQRLELESKQAKLEMAEADRIRRQEIASKRALDSGSYT